MSAPTSTHFHGALPIVLAGLDGYPTGAGELDEIEFDVLATPARWEIELGDLGLFRGKLLPSTFGYHAMFVHSMAPVAAAENSITIKVRCKGLIGNYNKATYEQGYEMGVYTPTGTTTPVQTSFPAIFSAYFVTTSTAAYAYEHGAVTEPPITVPDPFGGMADREWILSRHYASPVYTGETTDAVQGIWKVSEVLLYIPTA